jgi:hypothetical protein
MTTSTVTPEIVTFAQGVRAALADLPADEVDDLTEGLEADLAEAYAEDLQRELPDPAAYAAELRLAAGLPVRSKVKQGLLSGLGDGLRDTKRDIGIAIRRNPALAGIADFLVTLRPAWWIVRAWVAYEAFALLGGSRDAFVPTEFFLWLVLAAFVVISVQWGRGHWRFRGLGPIVIFGNVVAALLLIPMISAADSSGADVYYGNEGYGPPPAGTSIDGEQVSNIFAFDAKGNPLKGVQLFDQRGRPLNVGDDTRGPECDAACEFDIVRLPSVLDNGRVAWNVFPLTEAREEQTTYDEQANFYLLNTGEKGTAPTSPFLKVPAVTPTTKDAEPKR